MTTLAELAPRMARILRGLEEAGRDRDDDPCCPSCRAVGTSVVVHYDRCELGALLKELDQVESAVGDAFCFRASDVASITATRPIARPVRGGDRVHESASQRVVRHTRELALDLLKAIGAGVDEQSVIDVARILRAVRDGALEGAALACEHAASLRPTSHECAAAIRAMKAGL